MRYIDKRRLIFSFYLDENTFNNEINLLHIKLLERYINMFDEVIFCVIIDDNNIGNEELISRLVNPILSWYHGNRIKIKYYPNTEYRESLVFKSEIGDKMAELDGVTMFAHNKGMSDCGDINVIKEWVCSLYYFSLEEPGLDLAGRFNTGAHYYGSCKCNPFCEYDGEWAMSCRNNWLYCGTFFWGRYQNILEYMRNNDIPLPILSSRWYSEMFPGNTSCSFFGLSSQTNMCGVYSLGNFDDVLRGCYAGNPELLDNFYNFFDNIINNEQ